jgi:hypothetical protein
VDPAQTGGCWLHVPGDTRLPDRCRIGPDTVSCCCGAARDRSEPLGSTDWCYLTRVTCDCCMPAVTAGALPGPVAADGMRTQHGPEVDPPRVCWTSSPFVSFSTHGRARCSVRARTADRDAREPLPLPVGQGASSQEVAAAAAPAPTTGSTPARPSHVTSRGPRPSPALAALEGASSCLPVPVAPLPTLLP